MTRYCLLAGLLAASATLVPAALAQDLVPMDVTSVDPAMLKSFHGPWMIADASGAKTCKVVLKDEPAIRGSVIDIDPDCAKTFPIMNEIAGWRLMENWGIDLIDATRKTRIRFTTPDAAYIADPEIDGIATILQPEQ